MGRLIETCVWWLSGVFYCADRSRVTPAAPLSWCWDRGSRWDSLKFSVTLRTASCDWPSSPCSSSSCDGHWCRWLWCLIIRGGWSCRRPSCYRSVLSWLVRVHGEKIVSISIIQIRSSPPCPQWSASPPASKWIISYIYLSPQWSTKFVMTSNTETFSDQWNPDKYV